MRRLAFAFCAAIGLSAAYSADAASNRGSMPAPIVFFDIAGPEAAQQTSFYHDVFGWEVGPGGMLNIPMSGQSLVGALRQDPADKIIYLGVEDVAASLLEVAEHGGKVVRPRFEVKGVVILGLFTDPAGNSMGLVEIRNGKPIIP